MQNKAKPIFLEHTCAKSSVERTWKMNSPQLLAKVTEKHKVYESNEFYKCFLFQLGHLRYIVLRAWRRGKWMGGK